MTSKKIQRKARRAAKDIVRKAKKETDGEILAHVLRRELKAHIALIIITIAFIVSAACAYVYWPQCKDCKDCAVWEPRV